MAIRLVLSTCSTQDEAESLGRQLVEERLAACATALPGAVSVYWWEGTAVRQGECLLLLKTTADRVAQLEGRLHELHSYDCPEFLVLDVPAASGPYAKWVHESVGSEHAGIDPA